MSIRWHVDNRTCPHSNDDVCPTCDFDDYYTHTYPDCPWRGDVLEWLGISEPRIGRAAE